MTRSRLNISVVIPAYNEEKRIASSIKKIMAHLNKRHLGFEIIVVDDGSTDRTRDIVSRFDNKNISLLRNISNNGKGFSIHRGIMKSRNDLILITDADLSTPISELDKFLAIKKFDIIIASRAMKDSKIVKHQPFYREFVGKTFNLLVRSLLGLNIKDTQCGFKLFKKSSAKKIFAKQTIYGFSFDVEILYIAKRLGLDIIELPVVWVNDERTRLALFPDSIRMFIELLRIYINGIIGRYPGR